MLPNTAPPAPKATPAPIPVPTAKVLELLSSFYTAFKIAKLFFS
jgi:hypothetical protein